MKAGDRFSSFEEMRNVMQKVLGKAFSQNGAYIPHIPGNLNVCCAKHVFYNAEFPLKERWNEFEGLPKATVAANWNDVQWLKSKVTETIHEVLSPLVNFAKPGARSNGCYEPPPNEAKTRLVFGNFRNSAGHRGNNYVFLGVYEIDLNASKNANGYSVDAASFPLAACKMNSNIIAYPHQVWKRVSNVWG